MLRIILAIGGLALSACSPDETVRRYSGGDRVWIMSDLDGYAFICQPP